MSNKHGDDIPSREITPESVYLSRRNFLRAGALLGGVAATAGAYWYFNQHGAVTPAQPLETLQAGGSATTTPTNAGSPDAPETMPAAASAMTQEQRIAAGYFTKEKQTPFESVAGYNNFYEFSTDKYEVAELAQGFISRPWQVRVDGLVSKPKTFDLDDLKKIGIEERVYRHRCVEAWSMVIPWLGIPLASLLKQVEPLSSATYVRFVTVVDRKQMPNQAANRALRWPYVEGLRMDEAMHPLAILTMGLYGKTLPPQNGAPVRLTVPWKYGFKGIKSIVKIELVNEQPLNSWQRENADEYGFYSNVNPEVDHPRWSQASERRITGTGAFDIEVRPTLAFNGYADQVASLYAGMDLRKNF